MNTRLAIRQIRLNEWTTIIKECKASGQKVDLYCEQHGLFRDACYYSLCKVKEAALKQAGFVELSALTPEQTPAKIVEKGTSVFETQMIIKINGIEFCVNENSSSELVSRMLEIIHHVEWYFRFPTHLLMLRFMQIFEKELMDWLLLLREHLAWIQLNQDPSFCSVDTEMTGWKPYCIKAMTGFYAIKDLPMADGRTLHWIEISNTQGEIRALLVWFYPGISIRFISSKNLSEIPEISTFS